MRKVLRHWGMEFGLERGIQVQIFCLVLRVRFVDRVLARSDAIGSDGGDVGCGM